MCCIAVNITEAKEIRRYYVDLKEARKNFERRKKTEKFITLPLYTTEDYSGEGTKLRFSKVGRYDVHFYGTGKFPASNDNKKRLFDITWTGYGSGDTLATIKRNHKMGNCAYMDQELIVCKVNDGYFDIRCAVAFFPLVQSLNLIIHSLDC
jgi:hypothetical protein